MSTERTVQYGAQPAPGEPVRTYTGRTLEEVTIKRVDEGSVVTDRWGVGVRPAVQRWLTAKGVGAKVGVETRGFSTVTGWLDLDTGTWIERKSDEDLEAEHKAWQAQWEQEKRDRLEANREDWARREAALPDWIRARLADFRENEESPGSFDVEGWGYELVVAELAALYDALVPGEKISSRDVVDPPEIREYAEREGSSGNQHQMAIALVNYHRGEPDRSAAGTVSALSPITGKAGY